MLVWLALRTEDARVGVELVPAGRLVHLKPVRRVDKRLEQPAHARELAGALEHVTVVVGRRSLREGERGGARCGGAQHGAARGGGAARTRHARLREREHGRRQEEKAELHRRCLLVAGKWRKLTWHNGFIF